MQKAPSKPEGASCLKYYPGTELLLQAATRQLSSPQQRFTTEFGMGSEWFHRAIGTRKNSGQLPVTSYQLSGMIFTDNC